MEIAISGNQIDGWPYPVISRIAARNNLGMEGG